MSVFLDGRRFIDSLVKPNLSGYIISGAIHRIVPLIPEFTVLPNVASSIIAANPKSAKRAWEVESIKIFAYRSLAHD